MQAPTLQPHHMPFIRNCATLGIGATTLRIVDPVQFRARVDEFDFDITVQRFSFSTTPGDSLRSYFSSQSAALKGLQISPVSPSQRSQWIAYWDQFSRPQKKPRFARGVPETWWYDRDKAAKID